METRAPFVVIGIFTLVVVGGMMAFVHWAVTNQMPDAQTAIYDIDFDGSVAGLNPTGEVYFNGIKVGQVIGMGFVPEDPHQVRVRVKIAATAPVRSDTRAYLEYQGITGVTVIQMEGGQSDSPPLVVQDGQEYPRIPSRESELRQLLRQGPELLEETTVLIKRARKLLSADNLASVAAILDQVEQFTRNLAAHEDAVPRIVARLETMAEHLVGVAAHLEDIARQTEGVLGAARDTLATTRRTVKHAGTFIDEDLRQTARQITQLTASIDELITTAGPGFSRFSSEGLLSLSQLIREARLLVATLDRVGQRLESDPERFIFGDNIPEVELP